MMTVKDLMETGFQSSPDGNHWEPALPHPYGLNWRNRLRDAWAVWNGKAIAVRQTTKADITKGNTGAAHGITGEKNG
jgi:hypothetical protein